jgi:hypothetical protein
MFNDSIFIELHYNNTGTNTKQTTTKTTYYGVQQANPKFRTLRNFRLTTKGIVPFVTLLLKSFIVTLPAAEAVVTKVAGNNNTINETIVAIYLFMKTFLTLLLFVRKKKFYIGT